ncbi:hypothetical protein BK659_08425 [Pseudomonas brassicacearum]|uniref:Uncharacterized protein n=1 Tax=Pseudomonas brassicacearum TaxID=930166 RepID=A0A423H9N4_9PSED|nr:hypothetical protein BK659_08425 [Pseudomonas brassicacearum]
MAVGQAVKFLGKLVGDFPQVVAVFMNWCEMSSIDRLQVSLHIQWRGVGTLQNYERRVSGSFHFY